MIDREEIEGKFSEFARAFNLHDTVGMASIWAEQCDHIDVDGSYCNSRRQVEQVFRRLHSNGSMFSRSKLDLKVDRVTQLGPEVYAVSGSWQITGAVENGRNLPPIQGHVLSIFTLEDGELVTKICRPAVPLPEAVSLRRAA
jgi:uncharacterized protein (TIGR02246 family)